MHDTRLGESHKHGSISENEACPERQCLKRSYPLWETRHLLQSLERWGTSGITNVLILVRIFSLWMGLLKYERRDCKLQQVSCGSKRLSRDWPKSNTCLFRYGAKLQWIISPSVSLPSIPVAWLSEGLFTGRPRKGNSHFCSWRSDYHYQESHREEIATCTFMFSKQQ